MKLWQYLVGTFLTVLVILGGLAAWGDGYMDRRIDLKLEPLKVSYQMIYDRLLEIDRKLDRALERKE